MKAARNTVVGIAALCASGALVGIMIVGSGPVALCAGGCMTKGIPCTLSSSVCSCLVVLQLVHACEWNAV